MMAGEVPVAATIISCDIVGHGLESDHARQFDRIRGLNSTIRASLDRFPPSAIVWASGGDGGHVAFLEDDTLSEVLDLIVRLREWAVDTDTMLRITGHRGTVSTMEGADGRTQLVGEGINLCGSLVGFGHADRVIVTSDFRKYVDSVRPTLSIPSSFRFVDERVVYLKHFNVRTVYVLAFANDPAQPWEAERSDHRHLREAMRVKNPWQVIYHTKRLLQVDSIDPQGQEALNNIQPRSLTHGGVAHPLLGVLPRVALAKLLRASELIERDDGDIICQRNDSGDSMFIVLRGEIGVVTGTRSAEDSQGDPFDIRIGEGGIVGELALALNRPRTATLQSVGDTALLSMNYESLTALLQLEGHHSRLATTFQHFLEERIAEHLCRNAPYLQLEYSSDEAKFDPEPWDRVFDGVSRIVFQADQVSSLAFGVTPGLEDNGLYMLASGTLVEASESRSVPKFLSGEKFDVVFARIPGSVVDIGHEYKIDTRAGGRRVTMVRLSDVALREYSQGRFQEIVDKIRKRLAQQMVFDVFISYASENADLAGRWKHAFELAGLSVYMNSPAAMARFEPEIDLALAESRVLVPIISRASLKSDWVMREIEKRKAIFHDRHANILPVETEPRLAETMAVGFTSIGAGQRDSAEEQDAFENACKIVRGVADGTREPPFRTQDIARSAPAEMRPNPGPR